MLLQPCGLLCIKGKRCDLPCSCAAYLYLSVDEYFPACAVHPVIGPERNWRVHMLQARLDSLP